MRLQRLRCERERREEREREKRERRETSVRKDQERGSEKRGEESSFDEGEVYLEASSKVNSPPRTTLLSLRTWTYERILSETFTRG